ncbi:MAG TPA: hypothetical protein VK727_07800 [Steroidobacteraceae bacterium]|jgi:hypothetical protein|nr:hypothetical protein [Steroidobacteraceae bacterium]
MRKSTLLLAMAIAVCMLGMTAVLADQPTKSITLFGDDALARLQQSNPRHYAIARRILAAADEICAAAKTDLIPVKFDDHEVFCAKGIWLTSNPPKRYLQFQIEDTAYRALVVARSTAPKFDRGPLRAVPP